MTFSLKRTKLVRTGYDQSTKQPVPLIPTVRLGQQVCVFEQSALICGYHHINIELIDSRLWEACSVTVAAVKLDPVQKTLS